MNFQVIYTTIKLTFQGGNLAHFVQKDVDCPYLEAMIEVAFSVRHPSSKVNAFHSKMKRQKSILDFVPFVFMCLRKRASKRD